MAREPKAPHDEILAAIEALGKRQAQLETSMNEMIVAQVENAALLEALIEAIKKAPQVMLDGVEVETPADLDLNVWIENQKKPR